MSIERTKIRWNGWGWAAHKDELAGREEVWTWLAGELGMPALLATPARPLESIALPPSKLSAEAFEKFASILGAERVMGDEFERAFHALGRSYHDILRLRAGDLASAPDAVLYPRSGEEVPAVTLDLTGLDRIVAIDANAMTATVEAGIYGPALEKALAAKGFTLGHFPQSFEFSTLGGWIAHRGAGQASRGYGRSEN